MANTEAAQPAAPETEQKPVPQTPAAEPAQPSGADPAAAAEPAEPQKPAEPAKTYTQEDLDRITAKVKKNAAYRARKEAEAYYKGLQQGVGFGKPPEQPQEPAAPKEPQRDQFESYEAYLEARADYRAERKVEAALAKQRESESQRGAQTEQQKAQERFMAEVAEISKEIPDAQDILENSDAPLTNPMRDAIHASDAPARIALHLAQNPEEAKRIAALSSAKQAVEIGKLDARFAKSKPNGAAASSPAGSPAAAAAAAARAPSKAPAPINPVGGKVATGDEMPDARTQPDKWMEWRNRQLRARINATGSKSA